MQTNKGTETKQLDTTAPDYEQEIKLGGDIVKFEEEGETVAGYFVAVEPPKDDDSSAVLVMQDADGELRRAFSSKALDDALTVDGNPKATVLNKWLTIVFTGKKKIKGGKSFKLFSVRVRPNDTCPNPNPLA